MRKDSRGAYKPQTTAAVLSLWAGTNMTQREIAQALGLSHGTVNYHLRKSRRTREEKPMRNIMERLGMDYVRYKLGL